MALSSAVKCISDGRSSAALSVAQARPLPKTWSVALLRGPSVPGQTCPDADQGINIAR